MSTEQDTVVTESQDTEAAENTEQVADQAEETQSKSLSADEKKQQIVESFQRRLDTGELTLEEVEARQPWVAEALSKKEESPDPTGNLRQEILEEVAIGNTWRDINSLGLKADKLAEIRANEDKYKDDLGPKEALDLAVKLANIDTSVHAMRRRGMRLPAVGDGVTDDAIVISDADRKIAKMTGADPKVIAEKRKAATVKG